MGVAIINHPRWRKCQHFYAIVIISVREGGLQMHLQSLTTGRVRLKKIYIGLQEKKPNKNHMSVWIMQWYSKIAKTVRYVYL